MHDGHQSGRPYAELLAAPRGDRCDKPRQVGLTMLLDKGLGLSATRDLLELAAPYIDFIKKASKIGTRSPIHMSRGMTACSMMCSPPLPSDPIG